MDHSVLNTKKPSHASIDKKAKDIIKLLTVAVKQVPSDRFSIVHIAAEAMEGTAIEHRRTQQVREKLQKFVTEKPVAAVRFH